MKAVPAGAEAWVLAGGRSTRMGRDKAAVLLCGRMLLTIALEKLQAVPLSPGSDPRIAGSRQDLASYAPVIEDLHAGCGPLSGIEAALGAAKEPLNLFIPLDLPFVPPGFLAWMVERARITEALATYPRLGGQDQPLCAVYHRDLLPYVARSIRGGEHKVTRAIQAAIEQSSSVTGESSQRSDIFNLELLASSYPEMHGFSPLPMRRWFDNCNSPEDLAVMERQTDLRNALI